MVCSRQNSRNCEPSSEQTEVECRFKSPVVLPRPAGGKSVKEKTTAAQFGLRDLIECWAGSPTEELGELREGQGRKWMSPRRNSSTEVIIVRPVGLLRAPSAHHAHRIPKRTNETRTHERGSKRPEGNPQYVAMNSARICRCAAHPR